MRRALRTAVLAVATLAVWPSTPAMACPNCKEAVANQSGEGASIAQGYNWSVMFMVSMPFALLGTGALVVVRASRKGLLPEL